MAEKSQAVSVGVLHGPNLNLLGRREPDIYGAEDLEAIDQPLIELARELQVELVSFQSNVEGELVDWIQAASAEFSGLLVNAAAYTHTSIAIRDALKAGGIPFVEVHLTNIQARETFRHHSYLSDLAVGLVTGFGGDSYVLALRALVGYLRRR